MKLQRINPNWSKNITLCKQFFFFFLWSKFFPCSFSPMGMPLAQAQMTPPAGCLTCVPTRSWWCTAMTTSSVALPLWLSPRVAVCSWPATMTSTATSGTLWKANAQVSDVRRHAGGFQIFRGQIWWDLIKLNEKLHRSYSVFFSDL